MGQKAVSKGVQPAKGKHELTFMALSVGVVSADDIAAVFEHWCAIARASATPDADRAYYAAMSPAKYGQIIVKELIDELLDRRATAKAA